MKNLLLVLLLSCSVKAYAQDTIITNRGEVLVVKIIEADTKEVSYHLFDHQDGPVYFLPITTIFKIKYAIGIETVFPNHLHPIYTASPEYLYELGFLDGEVENGAEHFLATSIISLKFPLASIFVALAISNHPTKPEKMAIADTTYLQSEQYVNGLMEKSMEIRRKNAIIGTIVGHLPIIAILILRFFPFDEFEML